MEAWHREQASMTLPGRAPDCQQDIVGLRGKSIHRHAWMDVHDETRKFSYRRYVSFPDELKTTPRARNR